MGVSLSPANKLCISSPPKCNPDQVCGSDNLPDHRLVQDKFVGSTLQSSPAQCLQRLVRQLLVAAQSLEGLNDHLYSHTASLQSDLQHIPGIAVCEACDPPACGCAVTQGD